MFRMIFLSNLYESTFQKFFEEIFFSFLMRTCSNNQMKIHDAWRVGVMYVLVIEGVMSNSLRIERAAPFWHQKERETWQFPEACSNWKNICHAFRWAASIWSISSQRETNSKEWSKSGIEEDERVKIGGPGSITKDLLDRINRQERSKDWREKLHVSIAVRPLCLSNHQNITKES